MPCLAMELFIPTALIADAAGKFREMKASHSKLVSFDKKPLFKLGSKKFDKDEFSVLSKFKNIDK